MMTAIAMKRLLRDVPFVPFTLRANDGRVLRIDGPEHVIITTGSIYVGMPRKAPIAERAARFAYSETASVVQD